MTDSTPAETMIDDALNDAAIHARWVHEIKIYEQNSQAWEERGKKILRRFKDVRSPREGKVARYNILWSNIQTLMPALYGARPKADIERRWRDKDDLGRVSSQVLERATGYFLNEQFDNIVKQAVLDRLLPGRGTVWVRYEPHFRDMEVEGNEEVKDEGFQVTDDSETEEHKENETPQEVYDESVAFDYVHWQDFGHTYGRTWDEINAIWRKVYLSRDELKERFQDGDKVPLDYTPHGLKDEKIQDASKKATIYEIWDKHDEKAIWLHKDYPKPLDQRDDPLELTGFWPCPMPLYATLANDDMLPVPDYAEYQDQANELDQLTSRIDSITRSIKVAGVYDASCEGVQRLLAEGTENQLIPVEQWAMFAEKGGMKGVMELMPMQEIAQTLMHLYEARNQVKQDLYEITGMSDIMRGASEASESATAQKIKSQFASLRLSSMQDDVKRFCRDLVKIAGEIIANHFSVDTLKKISGVQLFDGQTKQLVQMAQQGAPVQLPPDIAQMDQEQLQELMIDPTWEEVADLLKSETMRCYKIDIETDSTLKMDQEADKAARIEFLQAVGQFISAAQNVQNPELAPLMAKMLMFGVRGFKVGKELESAFEVTTRKMEKAAENPPQPPPDPEMQRAQADMQIKQAQMQADQQAEAAKLQLETQKAQAELQMEQARMASELELEKARAAAQMQLEQMKMQAQAELDMQKAKLDAETKILVAQINAQASAVQAAQNAESKAADGAEKEKATQDSASMQGALATAITGFQAALENMSKPKQVVRDDNGRVTGIQ